MVHFVEPEDRKFACWKTPIIWEGAPELKDRQHIALSRVMERSGVLLKILVAIAFAEYCVRSGLTRTGVTMARTKKKIVRREWSKDDVRQLKTMAKAKAGVTKISKSLKRTSGATSVMAAKLGVSLSMRA